MFRRILIGMLFGLAVACQSECEEDAPMPLSFNLQWVNEKGQDLYSDTIYKTDSLTAFYHYNQKTVAVSLSPKKQEDTTQYYIDMMPLVRKAYELNLDSIFVGVKSTDIDTITLQIFKEETECFSTIYTFERLTYNGTELSGIEPLYQIVKTKK